MSDFDPLGMAHNVMKDVRDRFVYRKRQPSDQDWTEAIADALESALSEMETEIDDARDEGYEEGYEKGYSDSEDGLPNEFHLTRKSAKTPEVTESALAKP